MSRFSFFFSLFSYLANDFFELRIYEKLFLFTLSSKRFYSLFDLNTMSNQDKGYEKGLKKCYQKHIHIIYSDLNTFQFDKLRHDYSQLGTRGERGFGTIILDEVDSSLIDEANKINDNSTENC